MTKGLGVSKDCVDVDYGAKTVTISGDVDMDKVAAAFEGTRYSVAE